MTLPKQNEMGLPILECLKDKKNHHIENIVRYLEEYFELSKDDRELQKSSGGEGLFHNRIRWANFYLRKAGLVESSIGKGISKITSEGIELLNEKPKIIDVKFLMAFPKFIEYKKSMSKKR